MAQSTLLHNKDINKNDASYMRSTAEDITLNPSVGHNYANFGNSYYSKKGTKVHVHLGIQDLTTDGRANYVYVLPVGYRPRNSISVVGIGGNMASYSAVQVATSGAIAVYGTTGYITVDFDFDAYS